MTATFDFSSTPNRRNTGSLKWDLRPELLPMWVADMDFPSPPAVIDALHQRVDHGVFGYGIPPEGLNECVVNYIQHHYNWIIQPDWLYWVPGLVPVLHGITRAVTDPGDSIIVPTPVYPPFLEAPKIAQRQAMEVPFLDTPEGWKLDVEGIEQAARDGGKLLLLCNPHNPLGCVIPEETLREVGRICEQYGVILCSDEVHCDLILDDLSHTPMAALSVVSPELSITLMAASKTYNVAGLGCAYAIVEDAGLRKKISSTMRGISGEINPLGYVATQAALTHGEPWRQALLQQLRENRDHLEAVINQDDLPITMHHVEATYLAWLNIGQLPNTKTGATLRRAGLWLSDSDPFGAERSLRFNFGCPPDRLQEGLDILTAWAQNG